MDEIIIIFIYQIVMILLAGLSSGAANWHAHCEGKIQGIIESDTRNCTSYDGTLNPGGEK